MFASPGAARIHAPCGAGSTGGNSNRKMLGARARAPQIDTLVLGWVGLLEGGKGGGGYLTGSPQPLEPTILSSSPGLEQPGCIPPLAEPGCDAQLEPTTEIHLESHEVALHTICTMMFKKKTGKNRENTQKNSND